MNVRVLPSLLSAALALAVPGEAQQASDLRAFHRSGQTFLTWTEAGAAPEYRVYRSPRPLRTAADLASADYLGSVDEDSGFNRGRSQASGTPRGWIVSPGGPELAPDEGLFVHTVGGDPVPATGPLGLRDPRAYYAVTAVSGGVENTVLTPGVNATVEALRERPARPQPVLQGQDSVGGLYAHWVGNRATPHMPALSPRPSHGFNFRYDPGSSPGPRGLLVRLHAAGQTYAQGFPNRLEVPGDVDIFAPSDLLVGPGNTLWLGLHTDHPAPPAADAEVDPFTMRRVMWTLDWILAQPDFDVDPARLYLAGGSMGAMGSIYYATTYPDRFAAIFCRNATYDLEAPDLGNPAVIQSVFGSYRRNLPVVGGGRIYERTDTAFMAHMDPAADWPTIRTLNGRNDTTVGWSSAVGLYAALEEAGHPAAHYFDERRHFPSGYWNALELTLLRRTFSERNDRPTLRFSDLSLDGDPGDGDPAVGDPVGTINGGVDYDDAATVETPSEVTYEVFLRDVGALDDAAADSATVRLLPRRLQRLELFPGRLVVFENRDGATLIDEQLLVADEHGRVLTDTTLVTTTRQAMIFRRLPVATGPTLHLGGDRRAGGFVRWTVVGDPGQPYEVDFQVVLESDPDGAVLGGEGRSGLLDASGRATGSMPLPDHPFLGQLALRALAQVDGRSSNSTLVPLLD